MKKTCSTKAAAFASAVLFAFCGAVSAQSVPPSAGVTTPPADFTVRFIQYMQGDYFSGFMGDYLSHLAPRRAQGCSAPSGAAIAPDTIVIASDPNEDGEYEFHFNDDGRPLGLMWMMSVSVDYCGTQVAERFHFFSSQSGSLSVRDSALGVPYMDARRPAAMAEYSRQIQQMLEQRNRGRGAVDLEIEHSYPGDDDEEDMFD